MHYVHHMLLCKTIFLGKINFGHMKRKNQIKLNMEQLSKPVIKLFQFLKKATILFQSLRNRLLILVEQP